MPASALCWDRREKYNVRDGRSLYCYCHGDTRKVTESVAHESWLSKQQCETCTARQTARQTLPNCIHDLISTWRTYKCTSRNDSYRRHNIETINRIKFLRKYLDLEFIVEHLYRVSSVPRTSVSCAES